MGNCSGIATFKGSDMPQGEKMRKVSGLKWLVPVLLWLVAGCGGGGGGGGTNTPTISGIAAAGTSLTGSISLKDSSSPAKELSEPIAANGSFSFSTQGLTAPFLLKAVGTANGHNLTLYSFGTAAGIANINPLANLAVVCANGGQDLASLYSSPDPAKMHALRDALQSAVATVQTALHPTLLKFGAATVDFISAPYSVNHQGLDLFLDMTDISVLNGNVTIEDRTASNNILISLSDLPTSSVNIIADPLGSVGSVLVTPASALVATNATVTFAAQVIGSANQQVTWSVVDGGGGTITAAGIYTAPAAAGSYRVKATNVADPTKSATANVQVSAGSIMKLVAAASGIYTLQAVNFNDIAGFQCIITYDSRFLANPQVVIGRLAAERLNAVNVAVPGTVRFAVVGATPMQGAGPLATFSFDVLGASSGGGISISAMLINSNGASLGTILVNSDGWTDPADSTTGSGTGTGSSSTTAPVPVQVPASSMPTGS